MIRVRIDINLHTMYKYVHAIRIDPTNTKPDKGHMCTYKVLYGNKEIGLLKHPYGSALTLSIAMLEKVKTYLEE